MAETRDGRAERREEIKLRLEYLKVAISLGVIGTLLFAGLQWRMANQAALQTNYQRIVFEWRNHLATFVEKPLLRPYFEGRKKLTDDDPNREAVLALVDVRLDVIDGILTYAALRGESDVVGGWKNTFTAAFRTGPALCARLQETRGNYVTWTPWLSPSGMRPARLIRRHNRSETLPAANRSMAVYGVCPRHNPRPRGPGGWSRTDKTEIGGGAVTWRMVRTISIFSFAAQTIQP